uniref:Uncharacterized protein n=1 Tax=Lygus hesperus TaxID=30085 RepID=A0A146L4X5_LYGHE
MGGKYLSHNNPWNATNTRRITTKKDKKKCNVNSATNTVTDLMTNKVAHNGNNNRDQEATETGKQNERTSSYTVNRKNCNHRKEYIHESQRAGQYDGHSHTMKSSIIQDD